MPERLKRHQQNTNLLLHYGPTYKNFPVLTAHGPLIANYLERILQTIQLACTAHRRTFAVRFDLHLPFDGVAANSDASSRFVGDYSSDVISDFMASLKAQIHADVSNTQKRVQRKHHTDLRYVWVKEYSITKSWHYHVLLLLNNDTYHTLGDISAEEGNLAARIKKAWASALGVPLHQAAGLVHFCDKGQYRLLDHDIYNYWDVYAKLFKRVSYFAKVKTKSYGDNSNHFGCSRN